jgi:hypothetical protein
MLSLSPRTVRDTHRWGGCVFYRWFAEDFLEEAAMDGIPAIIIDPKGDLANLLLTFPGFQAWMPFFQVSTTELEPAWA